MFSFRLQFPKQFSLVQYTLKKMGQLILKRAILMKSESLTGRQLISGVFPIFYLSLILYLEGSYYKDISHQDLRLYM